LAEEFSGCQKVHNASAKKEAIPIRDASPVAGGHSAKVPPTGQKDQQSSGRSQSSCKELRAAHTQRFE